MYISIQQTPSCVSVVVTPDDKQFEFNMLQFPVDLNCIGKVRTFALACYR